MTSGILLGIPLQIVTKLVCIILLLMYDLGGQSTETISHKTAQEGAYADGLTYR